MSVSFLNFERGPGVPLLNFEGVPGPGSKGPEVLSPWSWSRFYIMLDKYQETTLKC